jgi:hypothetical protein
MITELCRGGLPCIAKKSNRPQNRRGCAGRGESLRLVSPGAGTRFPADIRNHAM